MSWKEKSLDELGYISRGRSRHRPRDAAHLYGGKYPFIQTGDVKHAGLYLTSYSQTYSEAGLAQSRLWPQGTLCITIAANIAETSILKIDACFPDSVIGFIPEEEKADARFIKYLFDALLKKRYKAFTQGAAQDNLSQEKLLSLKFPIPEFSDQVRIADVLSSYDDLIENNKRRIELLEEAARQLYKEWFVRFRFPGHEHVKIIDGIPEWWTNGSVGDIAKVFSGYAFKSKDWRDTGNPVVKIKNINSKNSVDVSECQCIDDNVAEKAVRFKLEAGDLLIAMTGATVGKVGLMPSSERHHYLNQRVGKFVSKIDRDVVPLLLSFFNSDKAQSSILNLAGGAAQPNISAKQIESIEMTIPTDSLLNEYLNETDKLFNLRLNLIDQNGKLEKARDLLLPKLMSGEIQV